MDALFGDFMHKDAVARIEEAGGMEQMLKDMKAAAAVFQIDPKTEVGPLVQRRQVERRFAMETANDLDDLSDIVERVMAGSFSCTHFSTYRD